ncbi:MAG: hypothetical protein PUC88_07200 [Clostridia bacterium]|nr:hypothetical protein [Clostridia bacterium]
MDEKNEELNIIDDEIKADESVDEIRSEETFETVLSSEQSATGKKETSKAFLSLAMLAMAAVVIVLGVVIVKSYISRPTVEDTVKACITAAYEFDVDQYVQYSTMNKECREKLSDSDYEFDVTYADLKEAFEQTEASIKGTYGNYEVNIKVEGTSIYNSSSDKYAEYLEKFSEYYGDASKISAFSSSDVTVNVVYESEEKASEQESQEVYGVLVDGQWYLVV